MNELGSLHNNEQSLLTPTEEFATSLMQLLYDGQEISHEDERLDTIIIILDELLPDQHNHTLEYFTSFAHIVEYIEVLKKNTIKPFRYKRKHVKKSDKQKQYDFCIAGLIYSYLLHNDKGDADSIAYFNRLASIHGMTDIAFARIHKKMFLRLEEHTPLFTQDNRFIDEYTS